METTDVITIIFTAAAAGFIAGYEIANRIKKSYHYHRGKLDGINEMWPFVADAWIDNLRLTRQHVADKAASSTNSNQ